MTTEFGVTAEHASTKPLTVLAFIPSRLSSGAASTRLAINMDIFDFLLWANGKATKQIVVALAHWRNQTVETSKKKNWFISLNPR